MQPRNLNDDQAEAVRKLHELKVGALFMECGTGKTQTASVLVNSVDGVDYLLWLCPCQTKDNLRQEIARCGLRYEPDIVGIESIGQSERIYMEVMRKLQAATHPFIVCDESIKIKNLYAVRTRRLLTLSRLSEYKLILNGTPLTKGLTDIYAQMEFLSPKILDMRYSEFLDTFCYYHAIKRFKRVVKRVIVGYANVDYLLSIIRPYVYQCSLNLPLEKQYGDRCYFLTDEEMAAYEHLKERLLTLDVFRDTHFFGIIQRMHHLYCCSEGKFELLEKLLTPRTIVYCKFLKSKREIEKRFPGTLVLTYGKGSFGLNLQAYNRIVYFDKTFDYAFREQSEARIYRTGQQEDCSYFDLSGNVGLEYLMDECIRKKTNLISYFKTHGNETIKKL